MKPELARVEQAVAGIEDRLARPLPGEDLLGLPLGRYSEEQVGDLGRVYRLRKR